MHIRLQLAMSASQIMQVICLNIKPPQSTLFHQRILGFSFFAKQYSPVTSTALAQDGREQAHCRRQGVRAVKIGVKQKYAHTIRSSLFFGRLHGIHAARILRARQTGNSTPQHNKILEPFRSFFIALMDISACDCKIVVQLR